MNTTITIRFSTGKVINLTPQEYRELIGEAIPASPYYPIYPTPYQPCPGWDFGPTLVSDHTVTQ